jgi:hypothetical protein
MIQKTILLLAAATVSLGAGCAAWGILIEQTPHLLSGWVAILIGIGIALADTTASEQ